MSWVWWSAWQVGGVGSEGTANFWARWEHPLSFCTFLPLSPSPSRPSFCKSVPSPWRQTPHPCLPHCHPRHQPSP